MKAKMANSPGDLTRTAPLDSDKSPHAEPIEANEALHRHKQEEDEPALPDTNMPGLRD
ncbi:hypothetical protein [Limoniibacter endophyticus]|uniref:Uncharacterized protein n=1 Tax=Limoniibacter endophyticus TaxID=1565040 RepID=A0A8J3DMS9_9HYPH|nr:hypothetical protein [Limoniibacter endophyticus]GHC68591.1 hypothetical protein GCM10010136_13450 [Limoniibacter endophyticus]